MDRVITVAVINVVMTRPHEPGRYIGLLQKAYSLRSVAKFRGDYDAILGSLFTDRAQNAVTGDVYKYLHLDVNEGWFNVDSTEPATEQDLSRLNIPENLKPHFQTVGYYFNAITHKFYFLAREGRVRVSAGAMKAFLERIFAHPSLVDEFGLVELTVVPDTEALQKIFAMPVLQKLVIEVKPPNPDDNDVAFTRIMEELDNQNAQKMRIEYTAQSGESLSPGAETTLLAEVAASNGYVYAKGKNSEGLTIERKTVDHPRLHHVAYDPAVQTPYQVLAQVATD